MPSLRKNHIIRVDVIAVLLIAASGLACADDLDPSVEQKALLIDSASGLLATAQPQKFLGARSCAASACHGGIDPDSNPRFPLSRRNEYVHWLDKDPHARSYQTLQNELSERILDRLSRVTDDDDTRATRLANCFGCHNPQPPRSQQSAKFYERDAVSCEMCHGPAAQWIGTHVTQAWQGIRGTDDAAGLGFVNTKDITTRAQMCAQCHVGSPGREVNHDLIAAGHPALKFELTAYHAMLPKHWRDDAERKANPKLEIDLWQAGQLACGTAAIELLTWRAERAAKDPPAAVWPEFAEYDCFACHHDLVHPSWRQAVPTSRAPLGMPAWGSWYFSRFAQPVNAELQELANVMQGSFRPHPAPVNAAANAVRLTAPTIGANVIEPATWDDAAQQYLALVARAYARTESGKTPDDKTTAAIEAVQKQLAFPSQQNSPSWLLKPGKPDEAGFTREQIHQSLLDLFERLREPGDE